MCVLRTPTHSCMAVLVRIFEVFGSTRTYYMLGIACTLHCSLFDFSDNINVMTSFNHFTQMRFVLLFFAYMYSVIL